MAPHTNKTSMVTINLTEEEAEFLLSYLEPAMESHLQGQKDRIQEKLKEALR